MYPVHWHAFVHHFNVEEYFHLKSVTKSLKQYFYDVVIKHAWQHIEMMLPNNFDLDIQYLDLQMRQAAPKMLRVHCYKTGGSSSRPPSMCLL